jgi:short-subunit dehydrogenase
MVERRSGAVLNVASTAGAQPIPGFATYAATKAFVITFSEAVHAELAGTGVSVTSLCPGPTRTEFFDTFTTTPLMKPDRLYMQPEDVARHAVAAMIAGKRTATPGASNKATAAAGRLAPRGALLPVLQKLGAAR